MSRSNTPSGHMGQPPHAVAQGQAQGQQQWRMPPELEVPPSRGAPGQVPAAGQYAPYAPNGQVPPGYAYPPQAYGQAPGQPDQGYAYAAPQAVGPGGHQFSPPPAASYAPPERYAAAPQMPDLRGSQYDQWPNQPVAAPQAQNPLAYDLGNYNPASPSATQSSAYQQPQPAQGYVPSGQHAMPEFNQPPQPAYGATAAYGNYAPPQSEYQQQWTPQDMAYQGQQAGAVNYDQQGYSGQPQGAPGYPAAHQQAAGQMQPAGHYDDEDEYEEEEPRRRGRGLMVVAALVGAIGLGGGLAYGYKTFMKPPTSGNIPVARADKQPAKIKPATPDGKQMAGNGSALQNADDATAPIKPVQASATANADVEANGSRKVQTMQVGRDGSIAAQQPQPTTVPGMQMVFPSTPNQQRAMPVPNLPESQPVAQPRVTANVPAPMNATAAAAVPAAPKKVAQAPLPKKPVVRDDLAASGGSALGAGEVAAPAAPRKPSGAGYMAVISLQKSQLDAMRVFADMQQKYPALQGKQPVVQEADLSAKGMGIVYRLMAGPPGSLASAKETCTQMTAAGHKDCWAMNY
jgi:hypothetical protein